MVEGYRGLVVRLIKAVNASLKDLRGTPQHLATILETFPDFAALGNDNLTNQLTHSQFTFAPFAGYAPPSVWEAQEAWMIAGGNTYINPADQAQWGYSNFVDMSYYNQALGGTRSVKSDKIHNSLITLAAKVYGDRTQWKQIYTWNKKFFQQKKVSEARAANFTLRVGTVLRY
jgi:hypothetical protein